MNRSIKRVLTIGGSDPTGGAGIQMDLKVFQKLGVWGLSCITCVTVQTTSGVEKITKVPPHIIGRQIDACALDIEVDACKIGMLFAPRAVSVVAERIERRKLPNVVLDPIIWAKGGRRLLTEKAFKRLKRELLPLALIVTPNIPEAEALAEMEIHSVEDMVEAGRKIRKMGARNVLVKGGHLEGEPVDVLVGEEGIFHFPSYRMKSGALPAVAHPSHLPSANESVAPPSVGHPSHLPSANESVAPPSARRPYRLPLANDKEVHGTGCILSSAISAYLAMGKTVRESVEMGIRFVREAIQKAERLGKGPYHLALLDEDF